MPNFILSAFQLEGAPDDDTPELCFIGRSNVGKSSLINALAREKIAFTSKTPGRTICMNFYDFKNFRLVDLPGYGYARASWNQQQSASDILGDFLNKRANLRGVFLICDASVASPLDKEMLGLIKKRFSNLTILLSKTDRLSANVLKNSINEVSKRLAVPVAKIIPFSAHTGDGVKKIATALAAAI